MENVNLKNNLTYCEFLFFGTYDKTTGNPKYTFVRKLMDY